MRGTMTAVASASPADISLASIAVPAGGGGLLTEAALPGVAARLGVRFLD